MSRPCKFFVGISYAKYQDGRGDDGVYGVSPGETTGVMFDVCENVKPHSATMADILPVLQHVFKFHLVVSACVENINSIHLQLIASTS